MVQYIYLERTPGGIGYIWTDGSGHVYSPRLWSWFAAWDWKSKHLPHSGGYRVKERDVA